MKSVLVTGIAGFIGSHLAEHLLNLGYRVIGLDNFDDFYDPAVKRENIKTLMGDERCQIITGDIRNAAQVADVFKNNNISMVAHLAARAGVRPSLQQPALYQGINVGGTINLLQLSHEFAVERFVFASSSSVYGLNNRVPFKENARIDCPASPYAASKAAGELFCRTYNNLYGLPVTVLRFFTVYGPRQRPEMAIHLFTRMIESDQTISVFGDGKSRRDYTYVGDIIDGIYRALIAPDRGFDIFNLGNSSPVALEYLIRLIEEALDKKAKLRYLPMQAGDMPTTFADISRAEAQLGFAPKTTIEEGVRLFVDWYRKSARSLASVSA
jgi:UDP-glucuronate 4-epimerase